jgi:hypothetical protein
MAPLLFPTFDLTEKEVELITEVYHTLKPAHPDAAFDFDFLKKRLMVIFS